MISKCPKPTEAVEQAAADEMDYLTGKRALRIDDLDNPQDGLRKATALTSLVMDLHQNQNALAKNTLEVIMMVVHEQLAKLEHHTPIKDQLLLRAPREPRDTDTIPQAVLAASAILDLLRTAGADTSNDCTQITIEALTEQLLKIKHSFSELPYPLRFRKRHRPASRHTKRTSDSPTPLAVMASSSTRLQEET